MIEEDEIFEWESRKSETSFKHHVVAGSCAGIMEHIILLPFDNIKTHSQILQNNKYFEIIKIIKENGGIKTFWGGASIIASGCIPSHAAYFSIYEIANKILHLKNDNIKPFLFGLTGVAATVMHDFILTPFDVQVLKKPGKEILKTMIKKEGFFSLYRSYPITLVMNLPWQFFLVSANETLKRLYKRDYTHGFASYFACAGISSSFASALTIPFDNIKTRLQTQNCYTNNNNCLFIKDREYSSIKNFNHVSEDFSKYNENLNFHKKYYNKKFFKKLFFKNQKSSGNLKNLCYKRRKITRFSLCCQNENIKYKSIIDTIRLIIKEEGFKGFKKGLGPKILSTAPSSAISWSSYEIIKKNLQKLDKKY